MFSKHLGGNRRWVPLNVGSCWLKNLTGFKVCATNSNNMQQHATGCQVQTNTTQHQCYVASVCMGPKPHRSLANTNTIFIGQNQESCPASKFRVIVFVFELYSPTLLSKKSVNRGHLKNFYECNLQV